MKEVKKIQILIVDDSAVARDGLRSVISHHSDFNIVGEAMDGLDAIDKVGNLKPDVILMDAQMPGIDGVEATRRIKERFPEIKILFLTVHIRNIEKALEAGVDGYLMKDCRREKLFKAIRELAYQSAE